MPDEDEAITISLCDFASISARSFSLSSGFSGAFFYGGSVSCWGSWNHGSTRDDAHLLDEVDFAVVFIKTRANELVVVQTGAIAQTGFLECWPDAFEVRSEFVRCIRAWVGNEHSETVCEEEASP
jgi:hypothetical protein